MRHFNFQGNSGMRVELMERNTVRKTAYGCGSARLERQIHKQKLFSCGPLFENIRTPLVTRETKAHCFFSVEMEFIEAKDSVHFLVESGRSVLDAFASVINRFILSNVAKASQEDVTQQIALKVEDLAKRGVPARYIESTLALCPSSISVPVGPCHGDLTLSNILFTTDAIYLIDFLDPFIESPLQDVVKLQQDTYFGWSVDLYGAPFDQKKARIALCYLNDRIATAFASFDWYDKHYTLFQAMNLMRILPYCKCNASVSFVSGYLDRLLQLTPFDNG
jgi:hypothetical protein